MRLLGALYFFRISIAFILYAGQGIEHLIYVRCAWGWAASLQSYRADFNQKLCVVHIHDLCVNFDRVCMVRAHWEISEKNRSIGRIKSILNHSLEPNLRNDDLNLWKLEQFPKRKFSFLLVEHLNKIETKMWCWPLFLSSPQNTATTYWTASVYVLVYDFPECRFTEPRGVNMCNGLKLQLDYLLLLVPKSEQNATKIYTEHFQPHTHKYMWRARERERD